MFYRFTKSGARIAVDLTDLYEGETLFLLGGSPTLKELPLELLTKPGVITLGVNNVPCVFRPNLWVCADKPQCFSPHIFFSPEITKFTMISRRWLTVPGTSHKMLECPAMYFFGSDDKVTVSRFLAPGRDIVWWRSVFPMALQLAWRLGFRTVYLVGCGFNMPRQAGRQYAWNTVLTNDEAQYSQNTYNIDVKRLRDLKPLFDLNGFRVISSTPGSAAHGILDYVPLETAVERTLGAKPPMADTAALLHSSALRKQ